MTALMILLVGSALGIGVVIHLSDRAARDLEEWGNPLRTGPRRKVWPVSMFTRGGVLDRLRYMWRNR